MGIMPHGKIPESSRLETYSLQLIETSLLCLLEERWNLQESLAPVPILCQVYVTVDIWMVICKHWLEGKL